MLSKEEKKCNKSTRNIENQKRMK